MNKEIDIDNYLNELHLNIINDNSITFKAYDYSDNKVDYNILRDQLVFFDNLKVVLHKVKILDDDIVRYLNPGFISVILNDDLNSNNNNGSGVHGFYDSDDREPCYTSILIENYNNYFPKIAYIHEIVHTQINEFKNIGDEYNKELMPLFFELLYSDTINYNNRINDRLYELGLAISLVNKKNMFENKIYIKSLLQALNLYRLYNKSSISVKNEIMNYVNLLLNRDIYLEDLLSIYEINYENSCKDLKTLKRSK